MIWYAIRTAPQREFAVEAMLHRKGYEVFLPIEVKTKLITRPRRSVKEVRYAMFIRYLFVGGRFSWLQLLSENHVSGVVGFDGRPAGIPDAEIARLRSMSGSAIPHKWSVNPHRAVKTGDLAEISTGPFAGQIVKVEGLHGKKARIFLNLFGSRKEVEIDAANLEAA